MFKVAIKVQDVVKAKPQEREVCAQPVNNSERLEKMQRVQKDARS